MQLHKRSDTKADVDLRTYRGRGTRPVAATNVHVPLSDEKSMSPLLIVAVSSPRTEVEFVEIVPIAAIIPSKDVH
jgi:hypothetical protein